MKRHNRTQLNFHFSRYALTLLSSLYLSKAQNKVRGKTSKERKRKKKKARRNKTERPNATGENAKSPGGLTQLLGGGCSVVSMSEK